MQRELKNVKHIAMLRLSALGDVTLMVPTVRAIQRHFPHSRITWIISKETYPLVKDLSGVEFIVVAKPKSIKTYWRLRQQLKHYRFDVLLAAQASLRANLMYAFINAPIKIGFDSQRSRDGHGLFINKRIDFQQEHLLDSFMRFAKALGVKDCAVEWDLPIELDHHNWAKKQLSVHTGHWVAINPAASKMERNWLCDRYVTVIERLVNEWQMNVVLTGGSSDNEKNLASQIIELSRVECLNLVGQTSMKQLAAILSVVEILISPDTGPLHIASAMGTPVIGLYAVASPELSGPYRSQSLVVNKYPQAVREILQQDPHKVAWGTRVHDRRAMALIEVDEVLAKFEDFFSNKIEKEKITCE